MESKPENRPKKITTVYMDFAVWEQLKEINEKEGIPMAFMIERGIEEFLAKRKSLITN